MMGRDFDPTAKSTMFPRGARRRFWIIPVLLAFALFLHRLDAQSFWYDEAVSARLASMSLSDLVQWTANDIQPPLYYLLLHGWQRAAGHSEWALRFFSVWWGTIVVVLAYVLAHRLSGSVWAGRLAILLFALAPWLLYYSQEARMYTSLVALSLAWVYVLIRHPTRLSNALKAGFLALLLLYTHYFALFLIVSLGLWHVVLHTVHAKGAKTRVRETLRSLAMFWGSTMGVVLLGYAPWAPFMLRRFHVDASYWGGTLKLNEALRHWAVHMTVGAPETALEGEAVRLLPVFASITILALAAWGYAICGRRFQAVRTQERVWNAFTLLLAWFLLPAFFVLGLAYRNPKFNPRYLMVVYPAWMLMWTIAPVLLLTRVKRPRRRAFLPVIVLFYLVPAVLFARADRDWFVNPAFTKPDFRSAIAYIRDHRRASEALFLVSGHMSPVVEYYAPELSYVRLPDIDVLDVNEVLDFRVAPRINQAIKGRSGVWLLLWQDEVVDPMGIVPYLLDHVAHEDVSVPNKFWHVRVRHFLFDENAQVPESPPLTHPAQINFDGRIQFLGLEYREKGKMALFFRALKAMREDVRLHMELWDDEGHLWGEYDNRPGPYAYPTFRWKPGQIVLGQVSFPFGVGIPAGVYTLRLRLYDNAHPSGLAILDNQGNPQGVDAIVPSIIIASTHPFTRTEVAFPPLPPGVDVEDTNVWSGGAVSGDFGAEALRVWPAPPWEPGQRIHAQIRWKTKRAPRPHDRYRLVLSRGSQEIRIAEDEMVGQGEVTTVWPNEGGFFTQISGRIPSTIPAGIWTLLLQFGSRDNDVIWSERLRQIEILPSRRSFSVPSVSHPVNAEFARGIRLVGIDVPSSWNAGMTLPVTVTWQALTEPDHSYTAFVHLLGPNGKVIAQEDHIPGRGTHPTDEWLAGEVIQDRFDIVLPKDIDLAELRLEIGWYDASAPGWPRLRVIRGKDAGRDAVIVVVPKE